jgi:hypothetical protein
MLRVLYACAVAALLAGSAIVAGDIDSRPNRMVASPELALLTILQR